jgi:uncharacterized protein YlaN (UPF0358 family)|nr:MAG TPA: hypothetical protein [Caudoviricetes sp.]
MDKNELISKIKELKNCEKVKVGAKDSHKLGSFVKLEETVELDGQMYGLCRVVDIWIVYEISDESSEVDEELKQEAVKRGVKKYNDSLSEDQSFPKR